MSNRPPGYQRFFAELKRRRVFRVMAVYGAVAFVVLQLADIALPGLGLPDWTMNLVLLLALLGFPFAIVLAWAFEVTPEGVRRTEEASPGELKEIIAAPAAKRWPSGLLALAGMTALLAGTWYIGRQSARATATTESAIGFAEASIAVLPFVNMSADPEQEYFSDGISEELLNLLAKIPQLRVASRTSAFSFKGENLEIPEIARRLEVAHVLEGSVRKAGNEVRITAQLIDARSDTHLWSETWDRTLEDIFAVQDEIAADVVDQLKVTLLGEAPTVEETDPEAYALALQARHLSEQRTEESTDRAEELYGEALTIDPDYAGAWSGRALNHYRQAAAGFVPYEDGFARASGAAERALAIDPDHAPAHTILATIAQSEGDLLAAARHDERALELNPGDAQAVGSAASTLQSLGRSEEAIPLFEYWVARDPVSRAGHVNLGLAYLSVGRWQDAVESFRTAVELNPTGSAVRSFLGTAMLYTGEAEGGLAAIEDEPDEVSRLLAASMAYHALDRAEESDSTLAELIDKYEELVAYNIAYVVAYRGEIDRAFEWLDRAVLYEDPGLSEIFIRPEFAVLHDDPRWLPFLESIGKSPAQLAAIEFGVTLPQ